jgi:nucleoside-diphosphate-sugar epimerase
MDIGAGKILVAGGGGFIGGPLVGDLIRQRFEHPRRRLQTHRRVASDIPTGREYSVDLRELPACRAAVHDVRSVFNLAADMGDMGFIETHRRNACSRRSSARTC